MARLLPRYCLDRVEDERRIAKAILAGDLDEAPAPTTRWTIPVGDDAHRLRGLPAVGRNVAGAIRGSNPEAAVLANERARNKHRQNAL
jgi:hypothetical protein